MNLLEIISEKEYITREEILRKFPGSEKDLEALEDDIIHGTTWTNFRMRYSLEPFSKFKYTANSLWKDIPADRPELSISFIKRVMKIVNLLQRGEPPRPVYITDRNYGRNQLIGIFEGFHRVVAFYLLRLPMVPVIYVSNATNTYRELGDPLGN